MKKTEEGNKPMSTEELLKPRYKVIALWPNTDFKIGQIVTDTYNIALEFYNTYPHLFKKLEWWEDRKPEDMPEYVKGVNIPYKDKVYKIADPSQNGRIWHIEHEIEHWAFLKYASSFQPATEQEYNEILNR